MHPILNTPFQIVEVTHTKSQDQERCTRNVKCSVTTRNGGLQDVTCIRSLADKVGDEHDQLETSRTRNTLRYPARAVIDTNLNTTVNSRCYIIGVTLCKLNSLRRTRIITEQQYILRYVTSIARPQHVSVCSSHIRTIHLFIFPIQKNSPQFPLRSAGVPRIPNTATDARPRPIPQRFRPQSRPTTILIRGQRVYDS